MVLHAQDSASQFGCNADLHVDNAEAAFRHGGPAGKRHLAATLGESRSRPEGGDAQAEKREFSVRAKRDWVACLWRYEY